MDSVSGEAQVGIVLGLLTFLFLSSFIIVVALRRCFRLLMACSVFATQANINVEDDRAAPLADPAARTMVADAGYYVPLVFPRRTLAKRVWKVIVFPVAKLGGLKGRSPFPEQLDPFKFMVVEGIAFSDFVVVEGGSWWWLRWSNDHSEALKKELPREEGRIAGHLSPRSVIRMDVKWRKQLKIPATATSFSWIFPARNAGKPREANWDPDMDLMRTGGIVCFDMNNSICAILALSPESTGELRFEGPTLLKEDALAKVDLERFHNVTLPTLMVPGMGETHFCWVCAEENFADSVLCKYGGFAYLFEGPQEP